jgi:hypothetical protein
MRRSQVRRQNQSKDRSLVDGVLDMHTRDHWERLQPALLRALIAEEYGRTVPLEVVTEAQKAFRPLLANQLGACGSG